MNHFLLPDKKGQPSDDLRYGVNLMELLINGLLQRGAKKHRLEAKVFGGARMLKGTHDIGRENGEFALKFLQTEGIPCRAQSLGGTAARRLQFSPTTGQVRQRQVFDIHSIELQQPQNVPPPGASEVEFFSS
ncbi:MAG: chemotaxis protein CheD [Paracoccaceae bacterium]|nr:chemotaxis protein CheD [Paracoccaceae bacterium]